MSTSREGSSSAPLPSRSLTALTDLNDLEVFARVVEHSGFSRAARELGVPASTVSRRIARLEENLGVRLLQRTTRNLHLTDAGRTYFERVSRALRELEHAETSLRAVQGEPRGLVRITTVNEPLIEDLLWEFMEAYPEVVLEVDKSHRRADLVAEGFDIAIRAGALPDSSLVAHKLMSSGPILVAAPSYLERRGMPGAVGELKNHDCVILGTSATAATWSLKGAKGELRVNVSGRISVNGFISAVDACRRGLGIGLFPRHFIGPWLDNGQLVEVLPEAAPVPNGLWIVYPSRNLVPPAVRALIDHIKENFPKRIPLMGDHRALVPGAPCGAA